MNNNNNVPNVLSQEMQTKENIANEKFNAIITRWNASFAKSQEGEDLTKLYAGSYINDDKDLVILVTKLSEETKRSISEIISLENVVLIEAKYSYAELKAEHKRIASQLSDKTNRYVKYISAVGISQIENAINLYIITEDCNDNKQIFMNEVKSSVTNFERVCLVESGSCAPCELVYPGTAISNRSVGFWARHNGQEGIITAPHATIKEGQTIKIGSKVFGIAEKPYLGGKLDAVFIRRTNSEFTNSYYVPAWGFELNKEKYSIPGINTTIYAAGATSGAMQGVVSDNDYTLHYYVGTADEVEISDCVLTTAICNGGDSGGIVACSGDTSMRNMVGIITGRVESTQHMLYIKLANIYANMDVYIIK